MSKDYSFEQAPAVHIVNNLINQAVQHKASDIHIEPFEQQIVVRFRINGVLQEHSVLDRIYAPLICARIKIVSHMNTAEYRLPQDGKFLHTVADRQIDIRSSVFPVLHGEKIMLRLLDQSDSLKTFEHIGMQQELIKEIADFIQRDNGFLMVTGPTGSGKTSTIYSILASMNKTTSNIVTLEDPIEYTIPGIMQSAIHYDIGFTFEKGLRSLLRQDPDVIFLGEIRDADSSRVALQSSLTGHLVMSTLHTHDTISAIMRLIDMGLEPYLIAAGLTGIISQRLVGLLCACKMSIEVPTFVQQLAQRYESKLHEIYQATGCETCNYTGIVGRTGVFEYCRITPALKSLIHAKEKEEMLYGAAQQGGLIPLQKSIFDRVARGHISYRELLKHA